jgi:hypothetical protein
MGLRMATWVSLALWLGLRVGAADPLWTARLPADEVHPCLLLCPADLAAVRARLERAPYRAWWEGVRLSEAPVSLAFTWLLTGDMAKAERVRQWLLSCNPVGYHCSCGVADALQGVAEAYDLVATYPGLTSADHRLIRARIAQSCERYYLAALESGSGQHPGNQRTRGVCAMGTAALVLSGYRDAAHTPTEWLQRALDGISEEANLSFWRADGMFIEGPGYSAFTLAPMLPFARYYARVSGIWLFAEPRLRQALLYLVSVTQPDGLSNAAGTTNMVPVVDGLRLAIGAGPAEDHALFRWAIDQWGSLAGGGVRDLGLFDDTVQPAVGAFPANRFLPVSQEASLRSDWSSNAVALWFRGKDPWLAKTHPVYSHSDTGGFILHAYGELLAVDAGYDHWVSYNLYPPELHNTLLVDGRGPGPATAGTLVNSLDAGVLQSGTVLAEYEGIALRRTFLLVDGRYVVIADRVAAPGEHEYRWQIHTPVSRATGHVEVEGSSASWTGFDPRRDEPGQVQLEAVWAGPVTIEAMPTSRWQPFDPDPQAGSYDNWALAAVQRGTGLVTFLTALCPHPLTAPPPVIRELPCGPAGQALAIEEGGVTDTFVVGRQHDVAAGGVTIPAETMGAVRRDGERVTWVFLAEGGPIQIAGEPWLAVTGKRPGAVAVVYPPRVGAGPVRIATSASPAGQRVAFRAPADTAKAWFCTPGRPPATIPLATEGGLLAVTLEALPAGVVLAGPAGYEPVADEGPPEIVEVAVNGQAQPVPLERLEWPRQAGVPRRLSVTFRDAGTGLAPESLRVRLDGLPPDSGVTSDAGRVQVTIPEGLTPTDHELLISFADSAALPNRRQFLLRFSLRPLLGNGGFEEGGRTPAIWSLGKWSEDAATRYEMSLSEETPHSGRRCLMMKGIAGHLNLVAAQPVALTLGRRYVLSGFYRGDVPASASFCSQSGKGQYAWMPPIGPSAEWVPFRWEFVAENPEARLLVALRLGAVGTACFDDVALDGCP